MKLGKKHLGIGIVAIAVIAAGGYYISKNAVRPGNAPGGVINIPAAVEQVRKGDISEIVTASGTVNASEINGVYIATTQKVSEVSVKLGDKVKIGDTLVKYDVDYSKKELENNLASQRISLQSSNLSLSSLTAVKSESEMLQLQNSINTAEKGLLDAQNNLNNTYKQIKDLEKDLEDAKQVVADNERLLSVGAITQEAYDQSLKAVETAEKNIKETNDNILSQEKSIANAEGSLKQSQLNYNNALTPLSDESSKINYQKQLFEIERAKLSIQNVEDQISDLVEESLSHVEGTIIELNVEDGSIVNNQTNIMKIADLNNLIVKSNVSEYDAPLLKVGQKVAITTDAIPDANYEGEITYISPVANVTNSYSGSETTVSIEIAIKNPDGVLKPGYSVDMEILVTDERNINLVSLSAVQKNNQTGKYYVYTVDESNMIHQTDIEMGAVDDMNTQILSGINEGDTVVSSPVSNMVDNTPLDMYSVQIQPMQGVGGGAGNGGNAVFGMPGGGVRINSAGGSAPVRMAAPAGGGTTTTIIRP